MISCLYNQACHLTDIEFKERHGVVINVQSMVENTEIYILACCPSNNQQILYKEGGWNFRRIYFKDQTDIFNNKRT